MSKVVHGGNIDELSRKYNIDKSSILDFSANINPIGINKEVKMEMIKSLDLVERYPDITYHDLKVAISEFENINYKNIVLGNGAAEVIFNLVRAVNPKKVLLLAPTFSEYEEAVLSVFGQIEYYILKEENDFKIDDEILDYIKEDIDMIFICNPNNPTGVLTENSLIEKIAKKALQFNITLVLDESFLDFVKLPNKYKSINLLSSYKNIFIVKSMTKFFAMPGIRIGYGICKDEKIVNLISDISVPWSVNVIAEKGAILSLKKSDYIKETIDYVDSEKQYLFNSLKEFKNIKVFKPSVNFIMFKFLGDKDLKEEMLKYKIMIRSCNNYKGLDNSFYRIAVRTRKENDKFLNVLKKIID